MLREYLAAIEVALIILKNGKQLHERKSTHTMEQNAFSFFGSGYIRFPREWVNVYVCDIGK